MTVILSIGGILEHLCKKGLEPETIIDVGVATGTPELYSRFPNAYYYMFEPLSHWNEAISAHLTQLEGKHFNIAAGDSAGEAEIVIPRGARPGGANISYDYSGQSVQFRETVVVGRLDDYINPTDLGTDSILKVDCQGYDVRAILGAEKLLKNISIIISECLIDVPAPHPDLSHLLPFLRSHGFKLFALGDFMSGANGLPTQVDCVFVRTEEFRKWK